MALTLYVGNKRLSSWSLRPYLALAQSGLPFEAKTLMMDTPTFKAEAKAIGPTGQVPVLHHDGEVIWDSLAICAYVNDLAPAAQLWPADRAQRARARCISSEMHSGFANLRRDMSCAFLESRPGVGHTETALADASRVQAIWREQLAASKGPFLFGAFTIADAMYAPVASRFRTYGVALDEVCAAYVEAIFGLPGMKKWLAEAAQEPTS